MGAEQSCVKRAGARSLGGARGHPSECQDCDVATSTQGYQKPSTPKLRGLRPPTLNKHSLTMPILDLGPSVQAVARRGGAYAHVFDWLNWAPSPDSPCSSTLDRCFPGAMPGTAVLRRSVKVRVRVVKPLPNRHPTPSASQTCNRRSRLLV